MSAQLQSCPLTLHNKILVAVDGSKYSDAALREAINISKTCNSQLFAVHVVYLNVEYMAFGPGLEQKMEQEAAKLLEKVKATAAKENVHCETILKFDDQPYRPIIEEAKARNINLIVLGTHGRTGLEKMLLGSVAQKVIGHAPCSVLVVPK